MEEDRRLSAESGESESDASWQKISPEESVATDASKGSEGSEFEAEQFRKELNELRESVDRLNAGFNSIKRRFLVGIATGLGTVIGATIVVSLLAFLLRPLANIEILRPGIESIIEIMDEERERQESEESGAAPNQKVGDEADLPRGNALPDQATSELQGDPPEE